MSVLLNNYDRLINALEVKGIEIYLCGVKIFKEIDTIPQPVKETCTESVTITSCQAFKQACLGDSILLTLDNIGCIAAAITFGFVDQHEAHPLSGSRVYTDIMKDQSNKTTEFIPPSPEQFTNGSVYACKDSNNPDFALFGDEDSGRYKTQKLASTAVSKMRAIQPPTTQGVFFYSKDWSEHDMEPDVVVLYLRPVELSRLCQAHQFITGERTQCDFGPVRAVNSDLIVKPYLDQTINITPFCVGARLIAQLDPNRMGMGIPYSQFKILLDGLEESRTGYPFSKYPGVKSY